MKSARWKKVFDLFQSTVERAPEERAAFLDEACRDDEGMDETLNRSLPNRCPDDFATNRDFAWQSHIHGNQLHSTMTRRTEFTASI